MSLWIHSIQSLFSFLSLYSSRNTSTTKQRILLLSVATKRDLRKEKSQVLRSDAICDSEEEDIEDGEGGRERGMALRVS